MASSCSGAGAGDGDKPGGEVALSAAMVVPDVVGDWEDDVVWRARLKALTGQRSDWEPRYLFWRSLILDVARRLRRCAVPAHQVRKVWFVRGGLAPLCIDQVLHQMHLDGDIILRSELSNSSSGHLHNIIRILRQATGFLRPVPFQEDILIFKLLVEERASEIIQSLSASHWNTTCLISMAKFQSFFSQECEETAVLSYLYQCQKAHHLVKREHDFLEGLKISLVADKCPSISRIDYDTLILVNSEEKLLHQLKVIDHKWEHSRKLALVYFKAGNKKAAYRHIRQAKMLSESRDKCSALLERVEELIALISDAESAKKVHDAIRIGNHAIKEHIVSIEEIHLHLKELDELVAAQKEANAALDEVPLRSPDIDDEALEEEFQELEEEVLQDMAPLLQAEKSDGNPAVDLPPEALESLSHEFHKLSLPNLEAA